MDSEKSFSSECDPENGLSEDNEELESLESDNNESKSNLNLLNTNVGQGEYQNDPLALNSLPDSTNQQKSKPSFLQSYTSQFKSTNASISARDIDVSLINAVNQFLPSIRNNPLMAALSASLHHSLNSDVSLIPR